MQAILLDCARCFVFLFIFFFFYIALFVRDYLLTRPAAHSREEMFPSGEQRNDFATNQRDGRCAFFSAVTGVHPV